MSKVTGFVLLLVAAGSAVAGGQDFHQFDWPNWWWHPFEAPEIDPASAIAGLTMLAGALAVIRGRRGKNKLEKQ
jgi:hypothetical protein